MGQVATQEVHVGGPVGDVVVIVAVGHGAADHEQQDLGQGVVDAAHVARVLDGCEVAQQHAQAGLLRHKARKRRHGSTPDLEMPPSDQPSVNMPSTET